MISPLHISSLAASVKAATGGDPYWSYVTNLLHFNGANNSTTFTDEKGVTWTPTNAVVSTTVAKLGVSSGYFNGSPYITASTKPVLGSNNFTIEFYFYVTSKSGTQYIASIYNSSGSQRSWGCGVVNGAIFFYGSIDGTSANIDIQGGSISINTWNHYAIVRNGSTFTLYLNGVAVTTTTNSSALYGSSAAYLIGVGNNSYPMYGYIDEYRLTNGVARYTANFTPPAIEFLNY